MQLPPDDLQGQVWTCALIYRGLLPAPQTQALPLEGDTDPESVPILYKLTSNCRGHSYNQWTAL